ncbi:hypothetical protein [Nitrospira sp. Nam80]
MTSTPDIDVYRLARAVGLRGGLKTIETAMGIIRRDDRRAAAHHDDHGTEWLVAAEDPRLQQKRS